MPVCAETYERVALEDPEGQWELHDGRLVQKPPMTFEHNEIAWVLGVQIQLQLGFREWVVRANMARVQRSEANYFIPDVMVIPRDRTAALRGRSDVLETYRDPLPLVVEVWSLSTGGYDINVKLAEYQRRGDLEIWRIHPYEKTLTIWRRQPDGSYTEEVVTGGRVQPVALPGVAIDLEELLA
jgi:Uma2 family endonuclease